MTELMYRSRIGHFYVAVFAVVTAVAVMAEPGHIYAQTNNLELSVASSELRNKQDISLVIANDQVQESKIEITLKDGQVLESLIEQLGDAGQTTVTLRWDTRTVVDGVYDIKYSAKFAGVWTDVLSKEVSVVNDWPHVTLDSLANGRTISGFVSRGDVTFRILSEGIEVSNPVVTIADTAGPDGMIAWSSILPASAGDDERTIEVFASVVGSGRESAVASQAILLTPLVPPKPPVEQGLPILLPTIEFAQEIGQFIAPMIAEVGQVKLFGVSVSDLTSVQPVQQRDVTPSVLGVTRSETQPSSAAMIDAGDTKIPLQATDKGWHVFGVAWYWLFAGSVAVGSVVLLRRSIGC